MVASGERLGLWCRAVISRRPKSLITCAVRVPCAAAEAFVGALRLTVYPRIPRTVATNGRYSKCLPIHHVRISTGSAVKFMLVA